MDGFDVEDFLERSRSLSGRLLVDVVETASMYPEAMSPYRWVLLRGETGVRAAHLKQDQSRCRIVSRGSASIAEFAPWKAALETSRISLWPQSPAVMDGFQVRVTLHGEGAKLCLSWWTDPPAGYEDLVKLVQWIKALARTQREGPLP